MSVCFVERKISGAGKHFMPHYRGDNKVAESHAHYVSPAYMPHQGSAPRLNLCSHHRLFSPLTPGGFARPYLPLLFSGLSCGKFLLDSDIHQAPMSQDVFPSQ